MDYKHIEELQYNSNDPIATCYEVKFLKKNIFEFWKTQI